MHTLARADLLAMVAGDTNAAVAVLVKRAAYGYPTGLLKEAAPEWWGKHVQPHLDTATNWANENVIQPAANKAVGAGLDKAWGQVKDTVGSNPALQYGLAGAGIGGLLGLGSSLMSGKRKKRPFSDMLTGGLLGGVLGGGAGFLANQDKPVAPESKSPTDLNTGAGVAPPADVPSTALTGGQQATAGAGSLSSSVPAAPTVGGRPVAPNRDSSWFSRFTNTTDDIERNAALNFSTDSARKVSDYVRQSNPALAERVLAAGKQMEDAKDPAALTTARTELQKAVTDAHKYLGSSPEHARGVAGPAGALLSGLGGNPLASATMAPLAGTAAADYQDALRRAGSMTNAEFPNVAAPAPSRGFLQTAWDMPAVRGTALAGAAGPALHAIERGGVGAYNAWQNRPGAILSRAVDNVSSPSTLLPPAQIANLKKIPNIKRLVSAHGGDLANLDDVATQAALKKIQGSAGRIAGQRIPTLGGYENLNKELLKAAPGLKSNVGSLLGRKARALSYIAPPLIAGATQPSTHDWLQNLGISPHARRPNLIMPPAEHE